jgi:ABC-type transporter Mla subunit MlaD
MQQPIQKKWEELSHKITTLQQHVQEAGGEVKGACSEVLDGVHRKQDHVRQKLEELSSASADMRDTVQSGVESALEELEQTYTKAVAYLEQQRKALFLSRYRSELEETDKNIEAWRQRIHAVELAIRNTLVEAIAVWHEKQEHARQTFQALQDANAENWEALKDDMIAAQQEVNAAAHKTFALLPENQHEYEQRLEHRLTELEHNIAWLQQQANQADTTEKAKLNNDIQQLRQQHLRVRQKYDDFQVKQAMAWQEFKVEIDELMAELHQQYSRVASDVEK